MSQLQARQRLSFIDVARSLAIVLALFSHAMATFGGLSALGRHSGLASLAIRFATPMFVFMFGIMLELVYARRARLNGIPTVARKLVLRSAQCYLGYQVTVLAGMTGGHLAPDAAARALLFLDNARFGNILRFYSIALLLAVPLIAIRLRVGPRVYVALLGCIWLLDGPARDLERLLPESGARLAGILVGSGVPIGPSVWHGMTFVLAGMLIGTSLSGWRSPAFCLRRFDLACAAVFGASALVVGWLIMGSSPLHVLKSFANFTYRVQNHAGYYAMGLMGCIMILVALSRVIPLDRELADWTEVPLSLGTSSLTSYTVGNVLLNLLPRPVVEAGTTRPILASAVVLLLVMWLVARPGIKRAYRSACEAEFWSVRAGGTAAG